jgi:site-specific DNA recombinase
LLFHLVSSLGEFYSDNLSKETNKGKYESSLQGYHNGHVPWGYVSELKDKHRVGVPDPEKATVVLKLFEMFATSLYSDDQMAEWLNQQGFNTLRGRCFSKDTIRDLLQCPYYMGKVRYKGMSVRSKGVSYRRTEGIFSQGQHEPMISEVLWEQCQKVRESRYQNDKTRQVTRHVYLLNGIIVCSQCGRRLRAQTPKGESGYYREVSHFNGFQDCSYSHTSVRSTVIDDQIAELIWSLKLPLNWEQEVKKLLQENDENPDPEVLRKELREQLRRMRIGYERGIYQDDEHVFWREVESIKDKLYRLEQPCPDVINQAVKTLLNLRESWEKATREEQRELTQMILQEVGCSVHEKQIVWVKPRHGFEILFQLASDLQLAESGCFLLAKPNGYMGHSSI